MQHFLRTLERERDFGNARGLASVRKVPIRQHHSIGLQLDARVAHAPSLAHNREQVAAQGRFATAKPKRRRALATPTLERRPDLERRHRRTIFLHCVAADAPVVASVIGGNLEPRGHAPERSANRPEPLADTKVDAWRVEWRSRMVQGMTRRRRCSMWLGTLALLVEHSTACNTRAISPDDASAESGSPDSREAAAPPDAEPSDDGASLDTLPSSCGIQPNCSSTPAPPVCDPVTLHCVQCLAGSSSCGPLHHCDPTSLRCVLGCVTDADCPTVAPRCAPLASAPSEYAPQICTQCASAADCPSGETCENHCETAGAPCPTTLTDCGGACTDTSSDAENCGPCGNICGPVAHATAPTCVGGACTIQQCAVGFDDCDGAFANGCETNIASDPAHCGSCGERCGAGNVCVNGVCTPSTCTGLLCPGGQACCDGNCTDLRSDFDNCGACGRECVRPSVCVAGTCVNAPCGTCPALFACCAGTCLQVDLDPSNCGGCGVVCGPRESCQNGACCSVDDPARCHQVDCPSGQSDCNGVCVDLSSDPLNCGACGFVCPTGTACVGPGMCGPCAMSCAPGQYCRLNACVSAASATQCGTGSQNAPCGTGSSCVAGECVCASGRADCDGQRANGCETDIESDANNCGGCEVACVAGSTCEGGVCM